jgi:hypothetical protein
MIRIGYPSFRPSSVARNFEIGGAMTGSVGITTASNRPVVPATPDYQLRAKLQRVVVVRHLVAFLAEHASHDAGIVFLAAVREPLAMQGIALDGGHPAALVEVGDFGDLGEVELLDLRAVGREVLQKEVGSEST